MFKIKVQRKKHKAPTRSIVGPSKVKVGFPAGKADARNIQKAVWNEFGTRGGASGGGWGGPIPERPFMRNAMRENKSAYQNAMRVSAVKILRGETSLSTVLSKLGNKGARDIEAEIDALKSPPNSPVTIAMKGSSNPLIDTGEMAKVVTFEVVE